MKPHFKIYIGSDHLGFDAKKQVILFLRKEGHTVIDVGPLVFNNRDDYTDYAIKVARAVQADPGTRGLLICGSGVGMYLVANKFTGIRAAESRNVDEAWHDREHHNSNVLVLGTTTIPITEFEPIITTWLDTPFGNGRHARRMKKLEVLETTMNEPMPWIVPTIFEIDYRLYAKEAATFSQFLPIINVDIADGKLVETRTPEASVALDATLENNTFTTVHFMTKNPVPKLHEIKGYKKVFLAYVHIEEITKELFLEEFPFEIGLVISHYTDVDKYAELYPYCNVIQIMTVELGKQGGEFIPSQLEIIPKLRSLGFTGEIHLDGGIHAKTIEQIMKYKPDVLNVGSEITKAEDPHDAYKALRKTLSALRSNL